MYKLEKKDLKDFDKLNETCFTMSNGLGGYTSGSVSGSFNRKHYGYLIAALKAPTSRFMILGSIIESFDNATFESINYKDERVDNIQYLKRFTYKNYPVFEYEINGLKLKKSIVPAYLENTVAIQYEVEAKEKTQMTLTPLFNFRDHNDVSNEESLQFEEVFKEQEISLTPYQNKNVNIHFYTTKGSISKRDSLYTKPIYFKYDQDTGDSRYDYFYTPVNVNITLEEGLNSFTLLCSLNALDNLDGNDYIQKFDNRVNELKNKPGIKDEFFKDLVYATDSFISKRESTGLQTILAGLPWFTDWGRDTMISFTGCTLVTKRFDSAREILKSFALYERNGLIPNMFPDDGGEPLYNTVDASLWYFYACYKYIEYTNDKKFILDEIYPTLQNIIYAYSHKTDNNIHMDSDGLISCGDKDTQITWMDVKTNGIAVTPRFGKPVEIQALWYNALRIMDILSEDTNDPTDYKQMAECVYESFNRRFFCEKTNCLYDTIDPNDDKIRPNQCFVLSLPFKVLDPKYNEAVFNVIEKDLYNINGLRSLSPKDKDFKPKYEGSLWDRDMAYHNGTTWGFLIGTYLDAYKYVNQDKENVKEEIKERIFKIKDHLNSGCLNGFAEVFNGLDAIKTKGCYTQAWSVAELLRAYYEDVLK